MAGRTHVVLITDGEQRAALALVRALGSAGHSVYVCSSQRRCLAGASRYCRQEWRVSDPLTAPAAFVQNVRSLVESHGIDVVIPVAEPAILALLPERARLGRARIPFPDICSFRRISDKPKLLAAAALAGIAIPTQVILDSPAQSALADAPNMGFPLVIKPARSVGELGGRRTKLGVRFVANRSQLTREIDRFSEAAYPLLLQQRIFGPGVGIFLLVWDGEVLASFSHRRLREKPPAGGVSVYRESIAVDPVLLARSRTLLQQFDWEGVAMVEYKVDAATAIPYLMEVNGRFWGSLQLAVDAGVDFPNALLAALDRDPLPAITHYREGVRSRWWWGDVDHLLARLRHSPEELALPPDAEGRWHAVREFLRRGGPNDRDEIRRPGDIRPFVRETIAWFTRR